MVRTRSASTVLVVGGWSLEGWAGYSTRSADIGFLGNMPNQRLALGAVRVGRRVAAGRRAALEYTAEIVPFAVLSPPAHVLGPPSCPTKQPCAVRSEASAHGRGVTPVGLTVIFRPAHALQLRLGATGGGLWFDQRVPTSTATRFNFTATLESGAQLVDRHGRGVLLVYRFHHLSNGGTGQDNPGIGSHVFSVGARWRLGP